MLDFSAKKFFLMFFLLTSVVGFSSSYAATKIQSVYPKDLTAELQERASEIGISDVESSETQSFNVLTDGRNVGTLIAGVVHNVSGSRVCFIAWKPVKSAQANLIPTIGFGDFETTTCDDTKSVGMVSSRSAHQPRIAIIYEISSPNATAYQSIILTLSADQQLAVDAKLTADIGSDGAKNMSELRKLYASKLSSPAK